ncbi:DUF4430 domain-containing protein [Hujiaoplasma nucleasis]|uniref:DUF4430 domain-containing protein n=1 Tax=Hujiaoplasma nucleasis TaxID=2725268 RepID=A0A7L6N3K9_9MOLU|nr:hypothetical protein [Hujiaoplasma nucleasis]QLY39645.1 DUF4430 domain-containing protein [Hujiaoplasma nucleasis]
MNISLKIKILLSVIMAGLLVIVMVFLLDLGPDQEIETENSIGQIAFILYDESNSVVLADDLKFYENDTLFTLLKRHYTLVCANQFYKADPSCSHKFPNGYVLLAIEDIESDWYNTVLTIYVNHERANYGVSMLNLNDGDIIEIKRTDYDE